MAHPSQYFRPEQLTNTLFLLQSERLQARGARVFSGQGKILFDRLINTSARDTVGRLRQLLAVVIKRLLGQQVNEGFYLPFSPSLLFSSNFGTMLFVLKFVQQLLVLNGGATLRLLKCTFDSEKKGILLFRCLYLQLQDSANKQNVRKDELKKLTEP